MNRLVEERIVAGYADGEAVLVIAARELITVQSVYNVLRRTGTVLRRARNIDTAKFVVAARDVGVAKASALFDMSARAGTSLIAELRAAGTTIVLKRGRPVRVESEEDRALRRLLGSPFPYPAALDQDHIAREFAALRRSSARLEGDVVRPKSNTGLRLCYPYFPNRYAVVVGGRSAVVAWSDRRELRRAIRLQLAFGSPTEPHRVLRAITLNCRTPSVFRPAFAKFVYERYAQPGQLVWDPCAGYGGRLLGAAAASVRYIGTDVDAETVEGNRRLASAVNFEATVIQCPAEQFVPPEGVSLVFTSPPYFDRERYSNSNEQSWRKHGVSVEAWLAGFLRPVIERAQRCLLRGGRLVLNVADIRAGSKSIPLVSAATDIANSIGLRHVETLQMPIYSINRKSTSEPVLVFARL